jgi:hypothetical protein
MQKVTGSTFVGAHLIPVVFEGLKFNLAKMRVELPDGTLLDKARFDVLFGGYTYVLDVNNERTTRSAWRAFTQSQAYRPHIV